MDLPRLRSSERDVQPGHAAQCDVRLASWYAPLSAPGGYRRASGERVAQGLLTTEVDDRRQ